MSKSIRKEEAYSSYNCDSRKRTAKAINVRRTERKAKRNTLINSSSLEG